jgi:GTPase SAR1 family protein
MFSFKSQLRYASGALVVFDLTSRRSFENVKNWIEELPGLTKCDTVVMIVGSKKDLIDQNPQSRAVTTEELIALAKQRKCLYRETSAYYDQNNIAETFTDLVRGRLGLIQEVLEREDNNPGGNNAENSLVNSNLHGDAGMSQDEETKRVKKLSNTDPKQSKEDCGC